jgi:hypothetical protein
MRVPLVLRAARGCAAATLIFSLSLAPSYARMGGSGAAFARPALGGGHFSRFAPRGFNRGVGFNRFGFNRFNRFGSNRFDGNQLLIGGGWGGWGWDGWGGASGSTGAWAPIIVGDGAPVIINVGVDPGLGDGGGAYSGGCVTHKLNYDSNGKYVGERQIPQC